MYLRIKKEDMLAFSRLQQVGYRVMFWGCFSGIGQDVIAVIESNLNRGKYSQLLENYILPDLAVVEGPMRFMEDNTPCHASKHTGDFLAANNVNVLE